MNDEITINGVKYRRTDRNAEGTKVFEVGEHLMNIIYNNLSYYGNTASYRGERTGGVLKGCPRGPAPTPEQMSVHARMVLRMIDEQVLGRTTERRSAKEKKPCP